MNLHQQLLLVIYFLKKKNELEFLKLCNTWWIIPNSKVQYSNPILDHAAKNDDGKPEFEQFTLSMTTAKAMIRTLRCQASLIEDLFDDEYDFILTARFQSDPLKSASTNMGK